MEKFDRKLVNTQIFTTQDAVEAAKSIFAGNYVEFEEIKNRPWYKKLLNAIVGGYGDRKKLHKRIRDLAQLQELIMNVYIIQMQSLDSALDQIMNNFMDTNAAVNSLYRSCVLKIKQQPEIQGLSNADQELLYIFLTIYPKENNLNPAQMDRIRNYNLAIAKNLQVLPPESAQDISTFEKIENADVFYRCVVEQAIIVEGTINDNMSSAISYLNISSNRKKAIYISVNEEKEMFGIEHIWLKYNKQDLWEEIDEPVNYDECESDNNSGSTSQSVPQKPSNTSSKKNSISKWELSKMEKDANKAVAVVVGTSAATCAIPIPFADAPILITEQVALLTTICGIYKINIKKDGLKSLVSAAFGIGGATLLGRSIASSLFKLLPGVGSITGGAISAGTASVVTLAMGKSFIEVCKATKLGIIREEDITTSKGKKMMQQAFKEQMQKVKKK